MELLKALEDIRSPFLDTVMETITRLGEETIAIVIICVIFWCISKKFAVIVAVVFFFSSLAVQSLKMIFRIDRPWVIDTNLSPIPAAMEAATGYSFPSGHTQTAAAIYGAIGAQLKKKPLMMLFFAIALLVAFSRLYLGVHTLQDVIASLVITSVIILVVCRILKSEDIYEARFFHIAYALAIAAIAVLILAIYFMGSEIVETAKGAGSIQIVGAAIGFAAGIFIEKKFINFSVKSSNIAVHAVKCILGIAGVIAFREVLIWNFEPGLITDGIVNAVLMLWITVIYPIFIKKFFVKKEATPAS